MSEELKVRISDYKIATPPDSLITIALGSCVGIAVYDPKTKVGGLSHIMLPDSKLFKPPYKVEKFADLAIPQMVKEIKQLARTEKLVAKIAGGASMFQFSSQSDGESIGDRNIKAVIDCLNELNIPLLGQQTGGNTGRTMMVDLEEFKVTVRSANRVISVL
ncbi:MAG: chemotaxis protein CheD [Desemzia incerta]|uniref:chemotaxis protein CheD n=1 Tax=Desemzia incerta TaxID=82801 RepID=UPI003315BA02